MTMKAHIVKPHRNIMAPNALRHPVLERCIAMPFNGRSRSAKPRMTPAATWRKSRFEAMTEVYHAMGVV